MGNFTSLTMSPDIFAMILFRGARLACWGVSLLLAVEVAQRCGNAWRCWLFRHLGWRRPSYVMERPSAVGYGWLLTFSAVLAAIPLLAFTVPIFSNFVSWLNVGLAPVASISALWALCFLLVMATVYLAIPFYGSVPAPIERMGPRAFKFLWCCLWGIFAHFAAALLVLM